MSHDPAARGGASVWVRLLDGAAVCLVALALWIAVVGGFRQVFFGSIVSATSALVFLYGAFSLLVARHLIQLRPSALDRLRQGVTLVAARPALAAALRAFLSTRPAIFLVGFLSVAAIGSASSPGFTLSRDPIENLPARFDAGWYGDIALDGYHWDATFQRQRNIAFFPAAPLLMRALGLLFHMNERGLPRERRMLRALWAGTVVSLAAFLWALHYLVRLGTELIGPERAASAAMLLAAYPFALFYSAPYTESLFLLGAVGTFFHFLRRDWTVASCWGLFAGLTRPNGCFLSLPLALLALQQVKGSAARVSGSPGSVLGPAAIRVGVAAAPVVGMLLFTTYLYGLTGVWFAWAKSHAAWGRTLQGFAPFSGFLASVGDEPLLQVMTGSPFNALNTLGLLFALALMWSVFSRLGTVWGVFVLVNLVPPLLAGGVLSIGRLTSTLFPLFLTLALIVPSRSISAWSAAFGTLQGLCAALFFTWRPLY